MALPHTFSSGTPAKSAEVNTNFNYLFGLMPYNNIHIFDDPSANPQTFTVPASVTRLMVECVGGGAGGDHVEQTGSVNKRYAASGGAGGYSFKIIEVTPGDVITVNVGAGGAGAGSGMSPSPASPSNGGTSNFGTHCSATGGTAGAFSSGSHPHGGVGVDGDINLAGEDGRSNSVYGPPGSSFQNDSAGHPGGSSVLGKSKLTPSATSPSYGAGGYGGLTFGSGAGGNSNFAAGQDGQDGVVIVRWAGNSLA